MDQLPLSIPTAHPAEYPSSLAAWLAVAGRQGRLRRASSVEVYQHMWTAFADWCIAHHWPIDALTRDAIAAFLASRDRDATLTARYRWRLLRLVDRVLTHRARALGRAANTAAFDLLQQHAELRFANAARHDPLPEVLPAAEARRLVVHLSSTRSGRQGAPERWQDLRNQVAVGLMLGAGLTPGEVRALQLADVVIGGGRRPGLPSQLRVAGHGTAPARETPLSGWAGRLLARWLVVRQDQAIPGTLLLPATRSSGKPWGKVSQYDATREVLVAAGLASTEGGSFRLRHTFALRQLRRGRPPDEVGRWLGVTDPGVMARYLRMIG